MVRLRDVAEVEVGAEDERTVARYNGQPAVGLGIVKQSKASTVDVAAAGARARFRSLQALLPAGMKLDIAYDSSTFIEDSIPEVPHTLVIAMCLVVLVILVFLKSLRATLIPTVAIPVSIIGTFAVAYFLGFTINILTLLALVLAIGLVVDDAIVVLENVYRHMEMGKPRRRAALDGAKEIGFAVVATTIALVAVFVPVAFLTGHGRAALQRVRHLGRGGGAHLGIRGADAHADALLADPPAAPRRRESLGVPLVRRASSTG